MNRQFFPLMLAACVALPFAAGCSGDSTSTDQAQSPVAPAPPPHRNSPPAGTSSSAGNHSQQPAAVEQVSPTDKQAVRQLMLSHRNPDNDLTSHSIDAITNLGAAIVPTLIELLDDDETYIRLQAARSLGDIGPDATKAVPALTKMLERADFEPGRAAESLGNIGPAARSAGPALVALVAQGDQFSFDHALAAVEKTEADTEDLEAALMKALRKRDPFPLSPFNLPEATAAIKRRGYDPQPAVPLLMARFNEGGFDAPYAAAALGELGPDAKAAGPLVMKMLQGDDHNDRIVAAIALRKMEVDVSAAIPVLLKIVQSDDDLERAETIKALGHLGPAAAAAVPELIKLSKSSGQPGWNVDRAAVEALGNIGPAAAPAIDTLVEIAKSDETFKDAAAVEALGKIGPPAVSALSGLLTEEWGIANKAAEGLGSIGPEAEPAIADLLAYAQSRTSFSQKTGAQALAQIGPPAVPALIELLQTEDSAFVRKANVEAATALGEMGADAQAALPALEQARPEANDSLKTAIDEAIEKIKDDLAKNPPATTIAEPESDGSDDTEPTVAEPTPMPIVRTWTSGNGSFSVEAELVEINEDMVTLKRIDNGRAVTVPIDKLSQADQDFLAEQDVP